MLARPRFHLDESVTTEIAEGLRQRGRDCTTSSEVGLRSAADTAQLAFALAQQRVLITRDQDFAQLHFEGETHAGIVYWRSNKHFGTIIRELDLLAGTMTSDELMGMILYL